MKICDPLMLWYDKKFSKPKNVGFVDVIVMTPRKRLIFVNRIAWWYRHIRTETFDVGRNIRKRDDLSFKWFENHNINPDYLSLKKYLFCLMYYENL